jgi:hypothetical protein
VETPFAAISAINNAAGGTTQMAAGCPITKNDSSGFAAAEALAKTADVVILALGIDESVEGEVKRTSDIIHLVLIAAILL